MERYSQRRTDCRRSTAMPGRGCGCNNMQDRSNPCGCKHPMPGQAGGGPSPRGGSCGCEGPRNKDDSRSDSCGCGGSMNGRTNAPCRSAADFNVCRPGACISDANAKVGIGYVPWQQWECTYPLGQGLFIGTVFPSLDKPFVIGRCAVRP